VLVASAKALDGPFLRNNCGSPTTSCASRSRLALCSEGTIKRHSCALPKEGGRRR
jgi:hypothetical protein